MKSPIKFNFLGGIAGYLSALQGYHIMALELIQNANDATATEIRFDVCDDALRVFNNKQFIACGKVAEEECDLVNGKICDFHAISEVASGAKSEDAKNVGRFGIGFISVYQITDMPIIRSSRQEMIIDPLVPERDTHDLPEAINDTEFYLPWAFDKDSNVRKKLKIEAVDESVCDKMLKGIEEAGKRSLFFLENLKSIKILRNGKEVREFTIERKGNVTSIKKQCYNSGKIDVKKYFIFGKDMNIDKIELDFDSLESIKKENRKKKVQVAVPCKNIQANASAGLVFAYLPTEIKTNMPIHINADFTPEFSRKTIVLDGIDPKGYHWNMGLFDCAIEVIENNLDKLRNELNYKDFSYLIYSLCCENNEKGFNNFQSRIIEKAKAIKCIYTYNGDWVEPSCALRVDKEITVTEQKYLSKLGFNIVHPDVVDKVGYLVVNFICLSSLVEKLEKKKNLLSDEKMLWNIYSITDKLCFNQDAEGEVVERLREINFIESSNKKLLKMNDMYKLPDSLKLDELPKDFPRNLILDKKFKKFQNLYELFLYQLGFDWLGLELRKIIRTSANAKEQIGSSITEIKKFYNFLLKYKKTAKNDEDWEAIPLMFAQGNFYRIGDVKLPSDDNFVNPFNVSKIIEAEVLNDNIRPFFKSVFGLEKQTLKKYIEESLAKDIENEVKEKDEISKPLYKKILKELTKGNNKILNRQGVSKILKEIALVKTEDGSMKKANDCYFKSPFLVEIFDDDKGLWVDTTLINSSGRQMFERLGVNDETDIRISDIENRIECIVKDNSKPTSENRHVIQKILMFLAENKNNYKDEIGALSTPDTGWLPATFRGIEDKEQWYNPEDLYHPKIARAFDSQAKIIDIDGDLDILDEKKRSFWDAIGICPKPDIATLIEHIKYCSNDNKPLHSDTYKLMRKLYANSKYDEALIEELKGTACIYHAEKKRYFKPNKFFWNQPNLPERYKSSSTLKEEYKRLFKDIGVRDDPAISDFVDVILEIAEKCTDEPDFFAKVDDVYYGCLDRINKEIADNREDNTSIELLNKQNSIATKEGIFILPNMAFTCKNEEIIKSFNGSIDKYILDYDRSFKRITLFLESLGIEELEESKSLKDTKLFNEESKTLALEFEKLVKNEFFLDVLSWAFYNADDKHNEIFKEYEYAKKYLRNIKFYSVNDLQIQYKFHSPQGIINSNKIHKDAFFDNKNEIIYIEEGLKSTQTSWASIFRAIFSKLFASNSSAISSVVAHASSIIVMGPDNALAFMREVGFVEPKDFSERNYSSSVSEYVSDGGEKLIQNDSEESEKPSTLDEESERAYTGNIETDAPSKRELENMQDSFGARIPRASNRRGSSTREHSNDSIDRVTGNNKKNQGGAKVGMRVQPFLPDEEDNSDQVLNNEIDRSAVNAVMSNLISLGYKAKERNHFNVGYDIIAIKDKEVRIIEVKGLYREWTEKGVLLSQAQMEMAYRRKRKFWLYVVELATSSPNIYRIQNPFAILDRFPFNARFKKFSKNS